MSDAQSLNIVLDPSHQVALKSLKNKCALATWPASVSFKPLADQSTEEQIKLPRFNS